MEQHFDEKYCPVCWKPTQVKGIMDVGQVLNVLAARGLLKQSWDITGWLMDQQYFNGNDSLGYVPHPDDFDEDTKYQDAFREMYKLAGEAGCPNPSWLLRW
jgi:hypothetical protein